MIIDNKLDKIAGPSGSFAGYLLIATGVVFTWFSLTGIPVIILGLLMSFTHTGCRVDTVDKKIQPYFAWFGLIRRGKWLEINESDEIIVLRYSGNYSTSSLSNRITRSKVFDYRIYLVRFSHKNKITIAKCSGEEQATKVAEELRALLTG